MPGAEESHADLVTRAGLPRRDHSWALTGVTFTRLGVKQRANMQVLLNTDHNIEGREALAARIEGVVERGLARVKDRITRVDVHLSDENSDKKGGGVDMRCVMEARVEGRPPVAVTDHAATVDQAVSGATHKLTRSIERLFERLHDKRTRGTG